MQLFRKDMVFEIVGEGHDAVEGERTGKMDHAWLRIGMSVCRRVRFFLSVCNGRKGYLTSSSEGRGRAFLARRAILWQKKTTGVNYGIL